MKRFKVSFDGVMDRLEELERENHRLRAENAVMRESQQHLVSLLDEATAQITAMRPIVAAVAEEHVGAIYDNDEYVCDWCASGVSMSDLLTAAQGDYEAAWNLARDTIQHDDDCTARHARAFLAAHPATEETGGAK